MKKLSFLLLAVILLVANSCKKDTVDVTDLLKTVPSSAGAVVVFSIDGLLSDADCKVKDNVIKPGKQIQALINKAGSVKQKDIMMFFDGSTGIEPKGAVLFSDANRMFVTFALYDVDKFCDFVVSQQGGEFTDAGSGVRVCGTTAVKGAQAWVCVSNYKKIDSDAIAGYSSLNSSQSFLVTPMGEWLLTCEDDVRGWSRLDILMQQMMNRRDRSMMTVGLGFLFDNAESLKFSVDFKKGELEAEALLLNDELKPAKFQFPADKVKESDLKTLGTNCDAMMAFTVSQKMIKKINEISQAFGGFFGLDVKELLKNVEGTVGLVAAGNNNDTYLNGFVTTKGEMSQELKNAISEYLGALNVDGKLVRFKKGAEQGNLSVAQCADLLKGSCFGCVISASEADNFGNMSAPKGFEYIVIKLEPESGSLELDVEAKTVDPQTNSLLVILDN